MYPHIITSTMYGFFFLTLIIEWSFLEWWVHSQPMHKKEYKKVPLLGLLTGSHTNHHNAHNYSPKHAECFDHDHHHESILQRLWFGPLVAFAGCVSFILFDWLTAFEYRLTLTAAILTYAYYWIFELAHVASHDGKSWQRTFLQKIGVFDFILKQHKGHHVRKLNRNYTLVNPLMDYVFNTQLDASPKSVMLARWITWTVLSAFVILFGIVLFLIH